MFSDDFREFKATRLQGHTIHRDGAAQKVILFSPNDGSSTRTDVAHRLDGSVRHEVRRLAKVYTVAGHVTSQQMVKECTGYAHNDHETNNKVTLHLTDMQSRSPSTGKLGATTQEHDGNDAPYPKTFDTDDQTKTYETSPSTDDLIVVMKPFVQP